MSRKVIAEVVVDASAARRGFNNAARASKEFGDGVTTVNARVTRSLSSLEKSILGTALAFGGAAGLIAGAKSFINVGLEAQATAAKLDKTIKTMGGSVAGLTPIIHQAEAAGRALGFANEESANAMNTLIRAFGATPNALRQLTVAQDLARASGLSLADAAQRIVLVQEGNIRSAKQFGIVLPDLSKKTWAHKAAVDGLTIAQEKGKTAYEALTQKIAGQGDAFAKTAAGGLAQFHAQIKNLEQTIGTALLPVIQKYVGQINAWLESGRNQARVTDLVQRAVKALTTAIQAIVGVAKSFSAVVKTLVGLIGGWMNALKLLITLKVAMVVTGWANSFRAAGAQAAAAGTRVSGLARALNSLKTFVGITIALSIIESAHTTKSGAHQFSGSKGWGNLARAIGLDHLGIGARGPNPAFAPATGTPEVTGEHGGGMGAGTGAMIAPRAPSRSPFGPGVPNVNAGAGGGGGGGGGGSSAAKSAAAKAAAALKKAKDAWAKELGDAIKHAVEVLNEQIRDFAPGLTARIKALGQQNKALTLQAAVHTGDSLDAINAQITGNLQDQASALSTEIARFKARFGGQKGLPAYRAKLAALQAQLSSTQDAIMGSLQNAVQAAQSVFQRSFSKVAAAFTAQFQAQTAQMIRSLGPMFSQGSLTASEAALAAMQREDQVKSLQDAIDQATTDAERAAAQRAMAEFQLGEAAARERAAADQGYADAVQQLTDQRTAQEARMTDALNTWAESVQNGTGNIADLAAIADLYGIHIDKLAIPSIDDLFSATDSLSSAFVALANYIYQLTGVAGPASSLLGNIALRGAQYQGMGGAGGMPSLDTGGLVTRSGLAEVHRGETYSGTGAPTTVQLILDSRIIGEVVWKELLRLQGRNGSLGFA